ncbi:hypothetical protein [Halalkalibacterium ligniniphilum]|uniref:hypothetical protein n=1 Tax=Halalkalibacterium ligniniphilum TaxID=1134413 RepID=UPI00034BD7D0|nr:hypothetical protein [Halalkalibacterium ligniniphilum]
MYIDVFVPYSLLLRIRQFDENAQATVTVTLLERKISNTNGRWSQHTIAISSSTKELSLSALDLPAAWLKQFLQAGRLFEIDQPVQKNIVEAYRHLDEQELWTLCKKMYPSLTL